jgi:bacterial/archaeal transporter family-2 protein
MEALFITLTLLAGMLLAVQAGANAQLSKAVGSPFAATTIQLGVGALVLAGVAIFTGSLGALAALPRAQWWHALGGLASALYVVAGIVLFPRLGAIVTVGLFIAGQVLASLALDTLGLLGIARQELVAATIGGAILVCGGVLAIVRAQLVQASARAVRWEWIGLGLLAGAVLPVQGAVNALLRAELGAPFAVAMTSFVVAMLAMLLALAAVTYFGNGQAPRLAGMAAMPWWGWLGGLAGAFYVTTVFSAMPQIGAAATVGFTVTGQQFASVLVDRYGLLRLPKNPITPMRMLGLGMLLAGVVLIKTA